MITHPFALEREMREHYHDQPPTHCFCAHAHEKQGCEMNHLLRETVEQVNRPDMKCKTERKKGREEEQTDRKEERTKRKPMESYHEAKTRKQQHTN